MSMTPARKRCPAPASAPTRPTSRSAFTSTTPPTSRRRRLAAALAQTLEIFEEPGIAIDFDFAPGEIQFVDNRALGHSRTEFEDFPEPERRRHLVRLWLRDHGSRAYPG